MCGINGLINYNKTFNCERIREVVHQMNEQIIHRGPNSEGLFADEFCALGMRRLSIIDLADGNQPIWNEKRDKLIVFNGELYNFIALRADLKTKGHHFYTNSDTEVVLHAYQEWGVNCLNRFIGMFAFAILDRKENKIFLARDRAGVKPLYYYQNGQTFMFASETKAFSPHPDYTRVISNESVALYFKYGYVIFL